VIFLVIVFQVSLRVPKPAGKLSSWTKGNLIIQIQQPFDKPEKEKF